MHPLVKLFSGIKKEWSSLGHLIDSFPDLAFKYLKELDWEFSPSDLQHLLGQIGTLPTQSYPNREFGELPYTLFVSENFFIDLYVWNSFETSIHDHHFCGAFKLVAGRSHHQVYQYEKKEKINSLIDSGNLIRLKSETLNVGSTQKIELGDKFIHQVCHLSNPTVTLCVRTYNLFDNLYSYHTSGLRFKYNCDYKKICKNLDYLDCVRESGLSNNEDLVKESIEIFESLGLIEIMACINAHRVELSSYNQNLLFQYMRKKNRLPDFESHLLALENEQRYQKKLFFLKHFNP